MTATRPFRPIVLSALLLASSGSLFACEQKTETKELAPKAAELKEEAKTEVSQAFEVETKESEISFLMDAELEKISGKAPQSAQGSLNVNLMNIEESTGLIKIDLLELSIFQKKRESADGEFGAETKNESQNEHMRTWLQISPDGPEAEREKNRYLEFKLTKLKADGPKDVLSMPGKIRKVSLSLTGSARLHGRVSDHTFPVEASFVFEGDKPVSLKVTTQSGPKISLDAHDVRPRSAFNILADKTLAAMGSKVSKVAEISFELNARSK